MKEEKLDECIKESIKEMMKLIPNGIAVNLEDLEEIFKQDD